MEPGRVASTSGDLEQSRVELSQNKAAGKQDKPPQTMSMCHEDYFELIILRKYRHRKCCNSMENLSYLNGLGILKRVLSF